MFDRKPTPGQEGRTLITPENGDAPFYAFVAMADNPSEEGTPLNKATLLADATAAMLGLDDSAVPNDALVILSEGATTEGTADALTLTLSKFNLYDGAKVKFKLHTAIASRATLDVNGLGAKAIVTADERPVRSGPKTGAWLEAIYSATSDFFVLTGKGNSGQRYAETLARSATFESLMCWTLAPVHFKILNG